EIHGVVAGPWGNEAIYPEWWGAQTGPTEVAWRFPDLGKFGPLNLDWPSFSQSVDTLALQSCFLASRSGQTVRLKGDYQVVRLNLTAEAPASPADDRPGERRVADDLRVEGYGST